MMNKSVNFLFFIIQLFIFKNAISMYNGDRYNFPIEKNHIEKKDSVFAEYMPDKDATLIFKTHFLWKLLGPEQAIFNDYHCVPFTLTDLICKYGRLTLDTKYQAANLPSYSCHGLYCKRFYNTLNVGSEEILFGGGFDYQNRLASVVIDENGYIFHAGFHPASEWNSECLAIKKTLSPEIERIMLLNGYKEVEVTPYPVNFNVHENVVPVNTIYPAPIITSLGENNELLMFPCPNKKDFFVTTKNSIFSSLCK